MMENHLLSGPKSGSPLLTGGGRLLEVPTDKVLTGIKFWCFELAVADGRWSLMRGGSTWRFDCNN